MVDPRALGGIVSTLALTMLVLHIVLSIALDWVATRLAIKSIRKGSETAPCISISKS